MAPKKAKKKPVWINILSSLLIIIGIFTFIIGIVNIRNYYNPYWFGFICGGLGLLVGICVNQRLKDDLFLAISVAFIGVFLMTGSFINQSLSPKCEKYQVINRQRKHYRASDSYIFFVDINGESHKLRCSREFWHSISKGQSVDLCLYSGRLGFDYISAKDDKWF